MEQTKRSISDSWDFLVPTVWNLNVRISDNWYQIPEWLKSKRSNTEQYSFGPERSKSEQDHTEQLIVRISALFEIRTFSFRTLTVYK